MADEKCPCGSGKNYSECCEPIIKGKVKAGTPEALMRSRYTAFAKTEVKHLINSIHPSQRGAINPDELKVWSERSKWLGLQILKATGTEAADVTGQVEFIARYADPQTVHDHHELSEFRKEDGEWFFYDGVMVKNQPFVRTQPKIERNASCPCGSGKKYKKCCGK